MSSADADSQSSTFVFADLAGFTALTEAHGDAEAVEIAIQFAARVRSFLPEHQAEEIKTIGDEVMIRVAAEARAGEVLLTEGTRRELGENDAFELTSRGSSYFKNIPAPVPVYRAVSVGGSAAELEIDPVCRMAVDASRAAATRHRTGLTYYFCSPECADAFSAAPRRYIATGPAARAARRGFLINLTVFGVVGGAHLVAWVGGTTWRTAYRQCPSSSPPGRSCSSSTSAACGACCDQKQAPADPGGRPSTGCRVAVARSASAPSAEPPREYRPPGRRAQQ